MTTVELLAIVSNAILMIELVRVRRRHAKYREAIHAMLQDEGHVEGEPELIVNEMLRMSVALGMKEPTLQEFAHGLVKQKAFRRAVAHEELHNVYVETHGR